MYMNLQGVPPLSPKKDSSRIYEMLAKRGLAEPMEPDLELTSDEADDEAYGQTEEAEALRRFFDEDSSSGSEPETAASSIRETYAAAAEPNYLGASINENPQDEDSHLDDYSEIGEIYRKFGMPLSGVDTVYLMEEYIATLPDSLPAEMRRSIVLKIVSASGFDFDRLLNDGIDRVTKLNEYSAEFASRTDELVADSTAEIEALTRKIDLIKEQIAERKNLHKRQFLAIESEAQRLKEVLDFITK